MDRYQKVEKPRPESAAISENEIRITSQGLIRNYVNYASSLLQERSLKVIVLKAMGQAISKAVAATEIIKKWNPHLHQDASISSVSITDVWEPIEEGLVPLETKRLVSVISITLSVIEPRKKTTGYQAPAQVEQPKRQQKSQQIQQPQQQQQHRQTLGQLNQDSYGRERGRGGGRGRGWARGGYGGYNNNQGGYYGNRNNQGGYNGGGYNGGGYNSLSYNQGGYGGYRSNQENGGWNANWSRGGGTGRGWNSRGAGPVYGGGGGYGGGPGGGGRNGNANGNGGGRGYGRGRGRVGSRGRGGY